MDLNSLRGNVVGTVLARDDDGFVAALAGYAEPGPAVIVQAATEADVAAAVRFAAAEDLRIAVRSGGHGGPIFSPGPDRVLIEMRALATISVGDGGVVDIGPGAVWGDVATEVQKHGYAITSGDSAPVGVAGLALGGGIGWLVRRDGLALDRLVGARVVLASGELVTASTLENPELFWALRGGGGNFGVVTSFRFQAQPLRDALFLDLRLDPERLGASLRGLRDVMRTAPDELNATFAVNPNGPPGPGFAFIPQIFALYAGADSAAARAVIAPLLQLPGVVASEVRQSEYRALLAELPGGPGAPIPDVVVRDAMIETFDDDAVDAVLAARAELGPSVFTVRFLGGAFGRVPRDATAFAHRSAEVIANIVEFLPPGAAASAARVTEAWAPVAALSLGSYGNFTSEVGPQVVAAMYPPPALNRLRAAKTIYDPHNRFADNENIPPV